MSYVTVIHNLIIKLPIRHNNLLEDPVPRARFQTPTSLAGSAPTAASQTRAPVTMLLAPPMVRKSNYGANSQGHLLTEVNYH